MILTFLLKALSIGAYSICLLSKAFSTNLFSGNLSLPVKNSCSSVFPDDRIKILAYCLFKLY